MAGTGQPAELPRAAPTWWERLLSGLVSPEGGADGAAGIVWCEDHLPTLVLLADTELATALSRDALAPLRQLRPGQADRLARTLLAWMESADDASAAARRLHVHPQTIRYRLRQVSGLFGDALNDPDARFRLLLALRVRQLLGSAADPAVLPLTATRMFCRAENRDGGIGRCQRGARPCLFMPA